MLKDFITENDITLNCQCKTWQEAVDKAAKSLLERNVIKPSYVEAIKRHHLELGPYMVIAPGIALAHARPEEGVNEIGLSFTVLSTPIIFGNDLNDPVKLVITLATPDDHCHLKMLETLMDFLMQADKVDELLKARNLDEAMTVLSC